MAAWLLKLSLPVLLVTMAVSQSTLDLTGTAGTAGGGGSALVGVKPTLEGAWEPEAFAKNSFALLLLRGGLDLAPSKTASGTLVRIPKLFRSVSYLFAAFKAVS